MSKENVRVNKVLIPVSLTGLAILSAFTGCGDQKPPLAPTPRPTPFGNLGKVTIEASEVIVGPTAEALIGKAVATKIAEAIAGTPTPTRLAEPTTTSTPRPESTPTQTSIPTSTPEPKPTATPRPSDTPRPADRYSYIHLDPGQSADLGPDQFVMTGNAAFNAKEFTPDNDPDTGVIFDMKTPARTTAVNGGMDIRRALNPADKAKLIEEARQEMLRTGGANKQGLRSVEVIAIDERSLATGLQPLLAPNPTATQTPRPTPTEIPRLDLGRPIEFGERETKIISGKTVISGDVEVNGIRAYHDSDSSTGAIVVNRGDAVVFAEFRASGNTGFNSESGLNQKTEEILRQKLTEFREVTVDIFENGRLISSKIHTREGLAITRV